jgi:hypothetical protein
MPSKTPVKRKMDVRNADEQVVEIEGRNAVQEVTQKKAKKMQKTKKTKKKVSPKPDLGHHLS